MIKTHVLYISLDGNNPQTALIKNPASTTTYSFGSIVAGDNLSIHVIPCSNNATSSLAGNAEYSCSVAIGDLGETPYATSSFFQPSQSYAWTGSLNTNVDTLLTPLGTTDTLSSFMEIQLLKVSGEFSGSASTILQAPITIRNQVISN